MKAIIGSISEGTLRAEDLCAAFVDTLRELDNYKEHGALTLETIAALDKYRATPEDEQDDSGLSLLVDELQSALENYAPPYFYFGTQEGDGACFGFWFSQESFDDAVSDGEVAKGDSLLDAALNADRETVEYLAAVTDHGNVTLYDLDGNEVWAIV